MRYRGFTLIELLVTIAVIVIMATIAVPGFQSMMASNQMATEYNEILSGLNYARSEAIKRRELVTFDLDQGWSYQVVDSEANVLRQRSGGSGKVNVSADLAITFNGAGRVDDGSTDCSSGCTITLSHDYSSAKAIAVSRFGRVGKSLAEGA
ncbi:GspH/FimT family pseudopilin [Halomonas cerina]|uniref:Type II secretion system protein H n=1 Tax=Halomonas cerina TaxID=447424 RepID=A0A839VCK0_9GAMM|nr:GspH/FimT family pseudopilin [Halomonas cerina]MBB3191670.1 type IV fimbrial biogenesis protein FimT [Halomonas cerina]